MASYIENISLVTCNWNNIDILSALAPGVGITFTQEAKWTFQPLGAVPKHVKVFNPDQSGDVSCVTLVGVTAVKRQLLASYKLEVEAPLVIYNSVTKERWTFNNAIIPKMPDMGFGNDAVQATWVWRYESLTYLPET